MHTPRFYSSSGHRSKSLLGLNFFSYQFLTDLLLINRSGVYKIYAFSYWRKCFFLKKWRAIAKAGFSISKLHGACLRIQNYLCQSIIQSTDCNSIVWNNHFLTMNTFHLMSHRKCYQACHGCFELRLRRYCPLWALKHCRSLAFFFSFSLKRFRFNVFMNYY